MAASYRYSVGSTPTANQQSRYFVVRVYEAPSTSTSVTAEVGTGALAGDLAGKLVAELNAGLTVLYP